MNDHIGRTARVITVATLIALASLLGACSGDIGAGGTGSDALGGASSGGLTDLGGVSNDVFTTDTGDPADAAAGEDGAASSSGGDASTGDDGASSGGDASTSGGDGTENDGGASSGGDASTSGGDGTDGGASSGGDGGTSSGGDGGASSGGDGSTSGGDTVEPVDYENLCSPCIENKQCPDANFKDAVCVSHGSAVGAYCAPTCSDDAGCATDYECKELTDVAGTKGKVCIPKGGEQCTCNEKAAKDAAATTCSITASIGGADATCSGTRKCGKSGVAPSECDAQTPNAEVCDGDDNDCDGKIDGGGDCDDTNACTDDACTGAGGCKHIANTELCDDGDACTEKDACADSKCGGTAPNCDDKNACTTDACEPGKGCVSTNAAEGTDCDDGDLCTKPDSCKDGACVAGELAGCDDGNPCTKNSCAVDSGKCATQTAADGIECDDSNACTTADACAVGLCTSATQVDCDDANSCTADSCDPQGGCKSVNDGSLTCDDANACTASSTCEDGACKGAADKDCDDGNPCTADTCDGATGDCVHKASEGPCDDGDKCTDNGNCDGGKCVSGPTDCTDANPCTDTTCDKDAGCVKTNNTAACEDDDKCNNGDTCKDGACIGGTTPNKCDDENPCTTDSCDKDKGCATVADDKATCEDGDACTGGDKCDGGKCAPGTTDLCACVQDTDCKDDGDLCNGVPVCKDLQCAVDLASVVTCDTTGDNACQATVCDGNEGKCKAQLEADGKSCNDGQACTTEAGCAKGVCTATLTKTCDDDDACTADSCNADTGECGHQPTAGCVACKTNDDCDNGDSCTDTCTAGQCVFVDKKTCATLADLTVKDLGPTDPKAPAYVGGALSLTYIVQNSGGGDAAASIAQITLTSVPDNAGDKPVVITLAVRKTAAIAAGKELKVTTVVDLTKAGLTKGNWKLTVTLNHDGAVKEASDANNSETIDITLDTIADLAVTHFAAAKTAYKPGESINATFAITNTGSADASKFGIVFALSTDEKYDKADIILASASRPGLPAGKTDKGGAGFVIPKGAADGTYHLLLIVDPTGAVPELGDANNIGRIKISVSAAKPANLIAKSVALGKKIWTPGESASVNWAIANDGGLAASGYTVTLWIAPSTTSTLGGKKLADVKGPTIAAGKAATGTASVTLPTSLTKKDWYVVMVVDSKGEVAEGDEKDNMAHGTVAIGSDGPDLTLTKFVLGNTVYRTSDTLSLATARSNTGDVAAVASADKIYLSTDAKISADDTLLLTVKRPALKGKTSAPQTDTFPLPKTTKPGKYFIGYIVDADGAVDETRENNNIFGVAVELIDPNAKANLIVSGFATAASAATKTPTTSFKPGDRVFVFPTAKVTNSSKVPAGKFTDALVGSANDYISTGDPRLAQYARSGLAAGGSYAVSGSALLPTNLKKGTNYWLALWTDRYNTVVESSDTDNIAKVKLTMTADGIDLRALQFTSKASSIKPGDSIVMSYQRSNVGGIASGAFKDAYYLSKDGVVSKDDVLLATANRASMAAGATTPSYTITLKIDAKTPVGNYNLLYKVDSADALAEISEANNIKSFPLVVATEKLPDLSTYSLTLTSTAYNTRKPGEPVSLRYYVKNQGQATSGLWNYRIYGSTSSANTITGKTLLKEFKDKPAIAVGATTNSTNSGTIPADVKPGDYYLHFWADSGQTNKELDEANNWRWVKITVLPKDGQCAAGVCCDLKTYKYVSKATKCGTSVAATQYRCSGATAQKRSAYYGCSGESAACQSSSTYYNWTGWSNVKTCATYTKCEVSKAATSYTCKAYPDLQPTALTSAVATPKPGATVSMGYTVKNNGLAATGSWKYRIYGSTSASNTTSGKVMLYEFTKPSIDAGKEIKGTTSVKIPATAVNGTYYLHMLVDWDGKITEWSESNNWKSVAVTVVAKAQCLSGACCDTKITLYKPKATKCGTSIKQNEYRCVSGKYAQLRQAYQGCSGSSTICQSSSTYYSWTAWSTIKTCASYTECVAASNGSTYSCTNRPDLQPTALTTAAKDYKAGQSVPLSYTVKNNGKASSGTWGYRTYGSTSSLNTTSGKTTLYTFDSNTSLAAGASKSTTLATAVKVPATAKPGTYYIHYQADYAGKIDEGLYESNNWRWVSFNVVPDNWCSAGTCCDTTKKQYEPRYTQCSTTIRQTQYRCATSKTAQRRYAYYGCPGSSTGCSTSSTNYSWGSWATVKICGTHEKCVASGTTSYTCKTLPDLEPKTLTSSSTLVKPGAKLSLSYAVKNNGTAATGTWGYRVYGGTSSSHSTSGKTALYNFDSKSTIAAGATSTGSTSTSITIPATTKDGDYYLLLRADYAGKIEESNESNNWISVKITVASQIQCTSGTCCDTTTKLYKKHQIKCGTSVATYSYRCNGTAKVERRAAYYGCSGASSLCGSSSSNYYWTAYTTYATCSAYQKCSVAANGSSGTCKSYPDLDPTALSTSKPLYLRGETVPVTYSVKNQGKASTGTWGYRIYGGTSASYSTSGKTTLYTFDNKSSLAAGATSTATLATSVKIPADAPFGTYYVLMYADYASKISEYYETNNWIYKPITIGPNCSSGTCCDSAGKYVAKATKCDSTLRKTEYRCSGTKNAQRRYAYYGCSGASSACSSSSSNYNWTAWTTVKTCGSYEKCASASTSAYTCDKFADLDITALSVNAASYNAGANVSVTFKTKNQGIVSAAGTFYDYVYLSQNTSTSSGNSLKVAVAQATLAANAERTTIKSFTLPKALQSGTWYVGVKTDATGKVNEYNEDSNAWAWTSFKINKNVAIDTGTAEYKLAHTGYYSGTAYSEYSLRCPTGYVARGYDGYKSSSHRFYRWRLQCTKLDADGTWGTNSASSYLGTTSSTAGPFSDYCSSNQFMVGSKQRFYKDTSGYQYSLNGYCRTPWDVLQAKSNSSGGYDMGNTGVTTTSTSYPEYTRYCPTGYVVTGIFGRASAYPRRVGYLCHKLKGAW